MATCELADLRQEVCDLKEAVAQLIAASGHPAAVLTNNDAPFSWDTPTQVGNIPVIPAPEVVVVADAAARAALAPTKLNSLLIQTTDATNGNLSVWAASGLMAGDWTLKTGTMASQNANNVGITGGTIINIADLAVADGGTGASSAANARVNLRISSQPTIGLNINWSLSNNFYEAITADSAITFSNAADGLSIMVAVASNGAWNLTWPAGVKWPGGVTPTHSGAGKTDVFAITRINGVLYGSFVQNFTT